MDPAVRGFFPTTGASEYFLLGQDLVAAGRLGAATRGQGVVGLSVSQAFLGWRTT